MRLRLLPFIAAVLCVYSCVKIDNGIARDFIPSDQEYDLKIYEFELEDIQMKVADSLSGYSNMFITFGALRDAESRLSTRASAVTLVPFYDTLDFGQNTKFRRFYFTMPADTVSTADESQSRIIQNVNVYELSEPISVNDANVVPKHGTKRVTRGVPVYNGGDSLTFDFSEEFSKKYLGIKQEDMKDMKTYLKKFPGIFFDVDNPLGQGGRINMFSVQVDVDGTNYAVTGSYANLEFTADYNGETKDTSFIFLFGLDKFYDTDSLLTNGTIGLLPQYAFNATTQEQSKPMTDVIPIEGGGSAKPVISAAEIKKKLIEEISQYGDYKKAFVHKAEIILPFEFPDNYKDMDYYPEILNPTTRIDLDTLVSFASLTNTSLSTENLGYVNRSTCQYAPGVSYHIQSLLRTTDDDKITNYDIWLMIMKTETYTTSTVTSEEDWNNYYQSLMYASYYSQMYSGYNSYGYGGYGYGGYGNYGYSNYLSYQMASSMLSDNATKQSSVMLDNSRYYKGYINSPKAPEGKRPKLKITYSVPLE